RGFRVNHTKPAGASRSRTHTRIVLQRDEARTIHHDNIKILILLPAGIRAAHGETCASHSETYPILRAGGARGVALRLISASGEGDNVAFVVDRVFAPSFDAWEFCGRQWRRPTQHIDRASQLCKFD